MSALRRPSLPVGSILSCLLGANVLTVAAAQAQQAVALDEISVTSPSPIQPPRAAVTAETMEVTFVITDVATGEAVRADTVFRGPGR